MTPATQQLPAAPPVHLHRSDSRFCGSTEPMRIFTLSDEKVTCPECHINICPIAVDEYIAYLEVIS
jgi:hypothetical protein